ncbi:hypothetical protein ACOSP7_016266 [Xanthoceras sorbifolium]|uniref:Uncharacterized protein n=1 Tax=Xanthoceras sorbifolium TaxID=99658 RepID=A0ABQ8HJB7_9ROSI|nr:hypothetical protein JRO89_XS10G0179100 [Xanthoceras sorbifolium]
MSEEEDHKKLLQNLPKLKPPSSSELTDHIEEKDRSSEATHDQVSSSSHDHDHEEADNCRTPTSIDNKIPTIQSCPPTPRKKKVQQVVFSHHVKRKKPDHHHHEFHFFEATGTGHEEVDSFFKSTTSSEISWLESHAVKKRCKSI